MMKSLTLKEAAQFLKMHHSTLREKASIGHIPGRKVGRAWVFIEEHLADFVSGIYHQPRE
jgi:excisionase family DNA binding protein